MKTRVTRFLHCGSARGFTFVELLVGAAVAAMVIGTSALTFQAISLNSKRYTSLLDVTIGSGNVSNFYKRGGSSMRCYAAPNYGLSGRAQEMRDRFRDDVAQSEGVFCLARTGVNTVRPEFIEVPSGTTPVLDTPEAFRLFLAAAEPTSAAIYTSYRNIPSNATPNLTIYLIGPETDPDYMRVIAVYEIDLVTPTNIDGSYASVRRYYDGKLTNYYDVFFPDDSNKPFAPLVVAFESESRLLVSEGAAIDKFKVGPRGPFYLIWWPDPTINPYSTPAATVPADGTARVDYGHMAGKTSYLFAVPMFPSLWGDAS